MITIDDLTVSFGAVQALRGVSFVAETGRITAVLGANGAGKTTLLRTISGLKEPSPGRSQWTNGAWFTNGPRTSPTGYWSRARGRGVIGEFTVEENLRLGAMMAKVNLQQGLDDSTNSFGTRERRKQHAAKLSGGERQMLAMAER